MGAGLVPLTIKNLMPSVCIVGFWWMHITKGNCAETSTKKHNITLPSPACFNLEASQLCELGAVRM